MPKLPIVAIIGRPNTGKSTLFNRLIGRRKAIVSPVPGTTRDHISHRIQAPEVDYLLIDTGGMGQTKDKDFEKDVFAQSKLAIEHADVILFTMNGNEEITSDDRRIADLLRRKRRQHVPVIVVLTKVDNPGKAEEALSNFAELAIGDDILPVSAPHNFGIEELNNKIVHLLKSLEFKKTENANSQLPKAKEPRIAIVGKPNVGKSSIVNAFMSETQRATSPLLVSPVAGTTRDATDTEIRYHGQSYVFVDTAGLKRRRHQSQEVDYYSMLRSIQAVEDADVTVLILDAKELVSQQDKRIARMTTDAGKGLIILINKMDLLKGEERKEKLFEVRALLNFCRFAPVISGSAKTKDGLLKLFDAIEMVTRNRKRRIPTRELRHWFEQSVYGQPLGEVSKSKHLTQADEIPPTFVIFVKNPKNVSVAQLRFLDNRLRETFGFEGTPVRWITKSSTRKIP